MTRVACALAVVATLAAGCGSARHPHISTPPVSAEYQPIDIRVDGLEAHERITLTLRSTDASGVPFASRARFRADKHGVVDLARSRALSGAYTGVWRMGLLTSMVPVNGYSLGGYDFGRTSRRFRVAAISNGRALATASFRRALTLTPLVEKSLTVARNGFQGTFAAPRGRGREPAVLELGGSEGGPKTRPDTGLASNGIAALYLGYFNGPGLPRHLTNVPLEYFRRALLWLRRQPDVDPNRVTVMGTSYGSQAALLLGVHYPKLVHSVAAIVTSNVVTCGILGREGFNLECLGSPWSFRGRPVPYTKQWDNPHPTDVPAAVIPVEKIRGPVFLTCGGLDQVWHSCPYAHALVARLKAKGFRYPVTLLDYPGVGHFGAQVLRYWPGSMAADVFIPASERAREALWPHAIAFLRRG